MLRVPTTREYACMQLAPRRIWARAAQRCSWLPSSLLDGTSAANITSKFPWLSSVQQVSQAHRKTNRQNNILLLLISIVLVPGFLYKWIRTLGSFHNGTFIILQCIIAYFFEKVSKDHVCQEIKSCLINNTGVKIRSLTNSTA